MIGAMVTLTEVEMCAKSRCHQSLRSCDDSRQLDERDCSKKLRRLEMSLCGSGTARTALRRTLSPSLRGQEGRDVEGGRDELEQARSSQRFVSAGVERALWRKTKTRKTCVCDVLWGKRFGPVLPLESD